MEQVSLRVNGPEAFDDDYNNIHGYTMLTSSFDDDDNDDGVAELEMTRSD